ncbi:FAD-dependent thymidylate synthase [Solibacillus isronensis]|uniref:FAD-dependent thymidylate synthase n=1 Tax=Solibacillus isronensis TaxID=412383 RepID=UPI0039A0F48E
MKIKLIHATMDYHKLVESVARVCYQSYEKDAPNSHNFIKAIMAKGHISVASVGNMVFEVSKFAHSKENAVSVLANFLMDLTIMHEITPFIKWSFPDDKKNIGGRILVSMNMLTFLDIYKERDNYDWSSELFDAIVAETDKVPHLKWFYDKSVQLEESPNEYTAKGVPSLYEPIVLDEDYTVLKALGLNEYELGIHAQITMNFILDRAASLQSWRHWSGGCELSQRYVERGNAEFRDLVNFDYPEVKAIINEHREETMERYDRILQTCADNEIRKGRAKEAARSILPNDITTQIIQSRPYRNWQHLFNLRDSNHAQAEIREDVRAMKGVLQAMNVIE